MAYLLALQGKKSIAKVKQISSPNENVPWAETYSVFSLYIVKNLQVLIMLCIILNILGVVSSALQGDFVRVDYDDKCEATLELTTLSWIYTILTLVIAFVLLNLYMM